MKASSETAPPLPAPSNTGLDRTAAQALEELETVADFIRFGASLFGAERVFFGHGTDNAVDEALFLVLHALHLEPGLPDELFAARLTVAERRRVVDLLVARCTSRRPAAYLTGRAWFAGIQFEVDERALVPRSPLAELITQGLAPYADVHAVQRVADVGTGSGCIAAACAIHWPWVEVDATDVSEAALGLAARNLARLGLADRVHLHRTDLLEGLAPGFDLIISNPPYVADHRREELPAEYAHEPALGLFSGADGLDHVRRLLVSAADALSPAGVLIVEVGEAQPSFVAAFADLEVSWVEFERGGDGVLVTTAEQLHDWARARLP